MLGAVTVRRLAARKKPSAKEGFFGFIEFMKSGSRDAYARFFPRCISLFHSGPEMHTEE